MKESDGVCLRKEKATNCNEGQTRALLFFSMCSLKAPAFYGPFYAFNYFRFLTATVLVDVLYTLLSAWNRFVASGGFHGTKYSIHHNATHETNPFGHGHGRLVYWGYRQSQLLHVRQRTNYPRRTMVL